MQVLIRKANIDDFCAIKNLRLQIEEAEYEFDYNLKENCSLDDRCIEKIKKDIDDKEKIYLVAEFDNKVIGFIDGEILTQWFYKEKIGMLNHICTDKLYRNNGVGQCLLVEFEKILKEKEIKYLRLNAFSQNQPAISFYEKSNFSEYSVIYQKNFERGIYMKLIVGLGNPGKEYENTRHNIGFMIIDNYVNTKNLGLFKEKDKGLFLKTKIGNEDVIFLKPQSYMNLSGEVVRKYLDFYKINPEDILIISDDLDLTIGNFKLKPSGSSGGHNGLKNIEKYLATRNYKRLKIGISNLKDIDTKDYVLGKLSSDEQKQLEEIKKKSVEIIDDYFQLDFSKLMNKYNQKNR